MTACNVVKESSYRQTWTNEFEFLGQPLHIPRSLVETRCVGYSLDRQCAPQISPRPVIKNCWQHLSPCHDLRNQRLHWTHSSRTADTPPNERARTNSQTKRTRATTALTAEEDKSSRADDQISSLSRHVSELELHQRNRQCYDVRL